MQPASGVRVQVCVYNAIWSAHLFTMLPLADFALHRQGYNEYLLNEGNYHSLGI